MKNYYSNISGSLYILIALIVSCLFLWSCRKEVNNTETTSDFPSQKDYFPAKVRVKYAKGFSIEYYGNYKVVKLFNPFKNSNDTLIYVLTQKGTAKPSGFNSAQFIEIPINTLACIYTTHVAFADILGATGIIKGMASPEYIVNQEVQNGLKVGKIKDIGHSDNLNQETLMALNPEVLMISGGGGPSDLNKYQMLIQTGISVLVSSEWMETSPLGRAEWFKLVSVLLNKENVANSKFDQIEGQYLQLKNLTQNINYRPSIITGLSFKDAWYIPGGQSFMSHFIKDAGATYPWVSDSTTASFPLNFETVYEKGLKAEYWINPEHASTLKDLLSEDSRYADFKPFKTRKIYSNNKRISANGSSEYWETGIVNPHIILADLIKIFHPQLLPTHGLYYYQPLR